MRTLQQRISDIDLEIHTLETATPRNSATVDRGGLGVVDEGSIIVVSGGTVFFGEGGSATSSDYSLVDGLGWQVGTERRGSSVVVLNDIPSESITVTTANSSVDYEEVSLVEGTPHTVDLLGAGSAIVQIFTIIDTPGELVVGGVAVTPTSVYKSQKDQWAYSYMDTITENTVVSTDMAGVQVRVARLSVNNAA